MTGATDPVVDQLLVPAAEPDRLVPLRQVPDLVERLTAHRPHVSVAHRWARRGQHGVTLRTVTVGREQHTTARWLVTYWTEVDSAKRAEKGAAPRTQSRGGRRSNHRPAKTRGRSHGTS